jgi:hypothetical protein
MAFFEKTNQKITREKQSFACEPSLERVIHQSQRVNRNNTRIFFWFLTPNPPTLPNVKMALNMNDFNNFNNEGRVVPAVGANRLEQNPRARGAVRLQNHSSRLRREQQRRGLFLFFFPCNLNSAIFFFAFGLENKMRSLFNNAKFMVNQLHQFVEEGHNLPQALRNVGEFLSKETLQTFLRRNENDTERLVLRLQEELNNFIRNLSIDNGERLDVDAIFGN